MTLYRCTVCSHTLCRRTCNASLLLEQYETNVEENTRQLHQRLNKGKYQAQPLRRVYIPKEDGKQRPIAIPVLEDKVVQKAVVDLLNAIYEQDFPTTLRALNSWNSGSSLALPLPFPHFRVLDSEFLHFLFFFSSPATDLT